MLFSPFKNPGFANSADHPSHCNSDERPAGIPDPHRAGYLICETPCLDCRARTWAARYPWGGWYSSPYCHACLDLSMTSQDSEDRLQHKHRAEKQAYLNAGLTEADLAVKWELDQRLRRLTRDPVQQCFAFLVGSTGTGKSSQAIAAIKHYVDRRWRCRYLTETDMIRLLQKKQLDIGDLRDLDLLVLDEFGSSNPAHWQSDWLREVIDGRYRSKRPTIFSSNHSLRALSKREGLGRLIVERIFECCRDAEGSLKSEDALYIECNWSFRIGQPAALPDGCINSPHPLSSKPGRPTP